MKYNTRTLHLRRFERFLRAIGSPHRAVPVIHVAGTKGKGSTAALLHSIAAEAGLRSGLFTSPHLETYCERLQINRRPVSKRRFAAAAESLRHRLETARHTLEPGYRTTFELLTTLALETFRDEGVRLAILETGLGGRLDATNVVPSEVAVITAIGLDHTHLLGKTHAAIAREKAGIIKPGQPVVVGRQMPGKAGEVLRVIRTACKQRAGRLHYAPRLVRILSRDQRPGHQRICCRFVRSGSEIHVDLPLQGPHQADNLQTALATVEILRRRGWEIPDSAIVRGVSRVEWPGRVEWIAGRPPLILDGAHCPLSAEALAGTLCEIAGKRQPVFIFSMLDDKPVRPTVEPLARDYAGCKMVVFRAPSVRGRSPQTMVDSLKQERFVPVVAKTPSDAVRKALALAPPSGLLVAFGSLYSVVPVGKAFRRLTRLGPRK